jgi:glycerol-3-phosphate dehydrogenase
MDYDVVVIGAGIQGAGVAQAAAAAGYSVLVLEQFSEPALGTSGRSSKLIHGGLRYLETGQFSLVRECLHERKTLLKIAPHLVELKPFHIPVYQHTSRPAWKIGIGLAIYSLFSRKHFYRIKRSEWDQLDGLNTKGLKTVYSYYDAQTDDAKLTAAVLESARQLRAKVHFNCDFKTAKITNKNCEITFQNAEGEQHIKSHALVNAAGPWVANTAENIFPIGDLPRVDLVQGAHIEIPGCAQRGMYYLENPEDKRAVFVMPWKGHLLVGTTENDYSGKPENVVPLEQEIEYLLSVYNLYFNATLVRSDVINAFAGLRVLPQGSGTAFSRPRDTVLIGDKSDRPRAVSLYGGKLTAYRATAEDVIKKLAPILPEREKVEDTKILKLPIL